MDDIIIAREEDFEGQPMSNGGFRWTSPAIFERHKAQVTQVRHPPDAVVAPHTHTVDEVFYLLEGDLVLDGQPAPTGSVIFIGGHTPYGFEVGERGVKWVMVRPNKADLAAADGTDYAWIKPGERTGGRGRALTPDSISRLPWEPVAGGLRRCSLVVSAGDPRVLLYEAGAGSAIPTPSAARHHFLCVTAGHLRVNDTVCEPGAVISVPAGTSPAVAGEGGPASFLEIESARD
jgi:quercetin dioxygenase-like cupin family protein